MLKFPTTAVEAAGVLDMGLALMQPTKAELKLMVDIRLWKDDSVHSLLKQCLTPEVFEELAEKKTPLTEMGLWDIIKSGVINTKSHVGVYIPEAAAYETFKPLLYEVIKKYHKHDIYNVAHPAMDWGTPDNLGPLDTEGQYVISTRVRTGRSLANFPLNLGMKMEDYQKLSMKMKEVFAAPEFDGELLMLEDMTDEVREALIKEHLLFENAGAKISEGQYGDNYLKAAGAVEHWPTGRGIYISKDRRMIVWVGEEDHLRIISMEKETPGDIGACYGKLMKLVSDIEKHELPFMRDPQIGFVGLDPTNIGTIMRASVHARLPYLSAAPHPNEPKKTQLDHQAQVLHLQIRGSGGENSDKSDGICDISNLARLGLTENQTIQGMRDGIAKLLELEESAEAQVFSHVYAEQIIKKHKEMQMKPEYVDEMMKMVQQIVKDVQTKMEQTKKAIKDAQVKPDFAHLMPMKMVPRESVLKSMEDSQTALDIFWRKNLTLLMDGCHKVKDFLKFMTTVETYIKEFHSGPNPMESMMKGLQGEMKMLDCTFQPLSA